MKRTAPSPALGRTITYLRGLLACGPIEARQAWSACRRAGLSRATVLRAKRRAGIRSYRRLPAEGVNTDVPYQRLPWVWSLPEFERECKHEYLIAKPILSGNTQVGRFLAEHLIVDPVRTISGATLRDLFTSWKATEGVSDDDLNWATLTRILQDFGCESKSLTWYGIAAREGTHHE